MNDDALERVLRSIPPGTLDALAGLPGADLTTAMIELSRRRVQGLSPSDILSRYRDDRFVRPGQVEPSTVRSVEAQLFDLLPSGFAEIALSPLVPIGTHGVGGVAQSRLLTTDRANEVAADPTNGLALEAAMRRRALPPRSPDMIHLAGSQRVVRAQRFDDEAAYSHFQLFGLVSAGRDPGNLGFEREALVEHLLFLSDAIARVSGAGALVTLTDWSENRMKPVLDAIGQTLPSERIRFDPDRKGGRGYYDDVCFKVHVVGKGEPFEVADGGFVDWTQKLLGNRKERLLIGGLGVERLAIARNRG